MFLTVWKILKGYIPSRKFNFSNTYRVECDNCVDDQITNKNQKFHKECDIIDQVRSTKKHTPISTSSELKREMDNFKDSSLQYKLLKSSFSMYLLRIIFLLNFFLKQMINVKPLSHQYLATPVSFHELEPPN